MPDAGRSNLGVNGRGPDVNFFPLNMDVANYPYKYREWGRTENHIPEHFDIVSTNFNPNTSGYGSYLDFYLDKRGDVLTKLELIVTRSALGNVGAGNTAYFNDFEGFSSIEHVEFYYSNKIFHVTYGEELMLNFLECTPPVERTLLAEAQAGYKTDAERALLSQIQSTWLVDLKVPWEQLWTTMPMISMPNQILVHVILKPLTSCVNYSGGSTNIPTCNLVSAVLRSHYVHAPQWRRIWLFDTVNANMGIAFKYGGNEFHHREVVNTASSSSQHVLLLRNIKNEVYAMWATLQQQQNVDNPNDSQLDLWNYQSASRLYLEDSGVKITNSYEWGTTKNADGSYTLLGQDQFHNYNIYEDQYRCFPAGRLGTQVATIPLTEEKFVMPSEWDCFGSRQFLKYNNPDMKLEFDQAINNVLYLDVCAKIHNLIIYQKGDIRKYLQ